MEKTTFTTAEAATIRDLLRKKVRASPSAQKPIRDKLRKIGFLIDDARLNNEPFRASDFDALIADGTIKIVD
jgi:hypothetical protein